DHFDFQRDRALVRRAGSVFLLDGRHKDLAAAGIQLRQFARRFRPQIDIDPRFLWDRVDGCASTDDRDAICGGLFRGDFNAAERDDGLRHSIHRIDDTEGLEAVAAGPPETHGIALRADATNDNRIHVGTVDGHEGFDLVAVSALREHVAYT